MQDRMQELQKTDGFSDAFSKIVSGKSGYKAVIEKKPMVYKCKGCQSVIDSNQKFCHECGTKVEKS